MGLQLPSSPTICSGGRVLTRWVQQHSESSILDTLDLDVLKTESSIRVNIHWGNFEYVAPENYVYVLMCRCIHCTAVMTGTCLSSCLELHLWGDPPEGCFTWWDMMEGMSSTDAYKPPLDLQNTWPCLRDWQCWAFLKDKLQKPAHHSRIQSTYSAQFLFVFLTSNCN